MLEWIDDMLGMTEQLYRDSVNDELFKSAMRSMVVDSIVLFKAGYFVGLSKCLIIPEQFLTYLGIDGDTKYGRFLVPQERIDKYVPLLQEFISRQWISYSELEWISYSELQCGFQILKKPGRINISKLTLLLMLLGLRGSGRLSSWIF